jgi:carbon monoxide dehydrogenase subunit G
MGRVSASLELPHPPDRVFDMATRIADLPRWLPEVSEAELLDPVLETGSRVRLKLSAAAAGVEVMGTVRQLRKPSILAIGGSGGPLTIEVRTRLQPVGDTATRISLEIVLSAPPLLGFVAREAERRINAELPAALERFRALMAAEPV